MTALRFTLTIIRRTIQLIGLAIVASTLASAFIYHSYAILGTILLGSFCIYAISVAIDETFSYVPKVLTNVPSPALLRDLLRCVFIALWVFPGASVHRIYPYAEEFLMHNNSAYGADAFTVLRLLPGCYVDWFYSSAQNMYYGGTEADYAVCQLGFVLLIIVALVHGVVCTAAKAKEAYSGDQNNEVS